MNYKVTQLLFFLGLTDIGSQFFLGLIGMSMAYQYKQENKVFEAW